jgi:hypothetical protein
LIPCLCALLHPRLAGFILAAIRETRSIETLAAMAMRSSDTRPMFLRINLSRSPSSSGHG